MILAAAAAGGSAETFTGLMDHVAQGFEALGAAILIVGVIWSFVLAVVAARRSGWSAKAYLVLRQAFGGTLLLGVEVLVAADLVRTVAVAPTLEQCPRARADRDNQDVPELLAGNRDRGRCPVAAGFAGWRGDDPPGLGQRAGVRDADLNCWTGSGCHEHTPTAGSETVPAEQLWSSTFRGSPLGQR